jgi:hypothetical protein
MSMCGKSVVIKGLDLERKELILSKSAGMPGAGGGSRSPSELPIQFFSFF